MTKRIAIQLFGHLRTFEYTFESFKKHILEPNKNCGYEIDIFAHSWEEVEAIDLTRWHNDNSIMAGKKLTDHQIKFFEENYTLKFG